MQCNKLEAWEGDARWGSRGWIEVLKHQGQVEEPEKFRPVLRRRALDL